MSLNANESKNTGKGFKAPLLKVDGYLGRIVQVIDLGKQEQRAFEGKPKDPAYEIMLTYELGTEFMVDENGEVQKDKPRFLTENFALYPPTQDKAKSTKRYASFDPANEHKGNFAKMVNLPVMIGVGHKDGTGKRAGTKVEKILTVSLCPSMFADKVPQLINEALVFDFDNPDLAVFKKLAPWVQEKIMKGLTYPGSILAKALGADYKPTRDKPEDKVVVPAAPVQANSDDDQPF